MSLPYATEQAGHPWLPGKKNPEACQEAPCQTVSVIEKFCVHWWNKSLIVWEEYSAKNAQNLQCKIGPAYQYQNITTMIKYSGGSIMICSCFALRLSLSRQWISKFTKMSCRIVSGQLSTNWSWMILILFILRLSKFNREGLQKNKMVFWSGPVRGTAEWPHANHSYRTSCKGVWAKVSM